MSHDKDLVRGFVAAGGASVIAVALSSVEKSATRQEILGLIGLATCYGLVLGSVFVGCDVVKSVLRLGFQS